MTFLFFLNAAWTVCNWFTFLCMRESRSQKPRKVHPNQSKYDAMVVWKGKGNLVATFCVLPWIHCLTTCKPVPFFSTLVDVVICIMFLSFSPEILISC